MDVTLIGGSAPEALSELLAETAGDYFPAEAGVRLVRGDVIDAGVVVLVVTSQSIFRSRRRRDRRPGTGPDIPERVSRWRRRIR